jgi:hypothetical protein
VDSASVGIERQADIGGPGREALQGLLRNVSGALVELSQVMAQYAATLRQVHVGRTPAEFVVAAPPTAQPVRDSCLFANGCLWKHDVLFTV